MSLKPQTFYDFAPFQLNPPERVLLRDGSPVPLPPKAFDLLVVLVEHAGRLVTKEQLLKEVWPGTFVEEANLSYTVSLLRKALADDAEPHEFIETVSKRGYRFKPITTVGVLLEKDPKRRLHDIGDARELIDDAGAIGAPNQPGPRSRPVLLAGLLLAAAALGAAVALVARRQPDIASMPVSRFVETLPDTAPRFVANGTNIAVSRDGRAVVYRVFENGVGWRLYRRFMDELDGAFIGDVGAAEPFFSPDGQWVGFNVGKALRRVSIRRGPAEQIATLPNSFRGASWTADGTILLGGGTAGLQRMTEHGGTVTTLVKPADGRTISYPQLLPGERAVLYTERASSQPAVGELVVFDFAAGRAKPLVPGFAGRYVSTGHLVFLRGSTLWAVAFDIDRLEPRGDPKIVLENVRALRGTAEGIQAPFMGTAVADTGTLVYALAAASPQRSLVWVDRRGVEQPVTDSPARAYANPRLSPDGKQIAVPMRDEGLDVWIWDVEGRHLRQLTSDPQPNYVAAWFPDSQRLAFSRERGGVYWQAADGSGVPLPLIEKSGFPMTISLDGSVVLQSVDRAPALRWGLLLMPPGDRKTLQPLGQTSASQRNPDISPDGRWLAYESDGTGQFEISVRPFPNVQDGEWPVTRGGALAPLWSRDGRELFFWRQTGSMISMMSVPVVTGPAFRVAGEARELFRGPYAQPSWDRQYDIAPDGRFLLMKTTTASPREQIVIVSNWFDELKRLVPTK